MAETRTYQGHTYTRNGPGEPWVLVVGGQAPGPVTLGTPDPTAPLQVPQAQADLDRTRTQNAVDAAALGKVDDLGESTQATWNITIEREDYEKPCVVAEWIVRYYAAGAV